MPKASDPPQLEIEGDVYRFSYPDGIRLTVEDVFMQDVTKRLWGLCTGVGPDGLVTSLRIEFFNIQDYEHFQRRAASMNGHLKVNWIQRLEFAATHLRRILHETTPTTDSAPAAQVDPWPTLDTKAYQGLAGILAIAIDPYTEADPFAVLLNILTGFGNLIGAGLYFRVEHTRHALRLFVVLVGETAKGRKGTSWSTPRHVFSAIDESWVRDRVTAGLSSGEGLIYAVRDERWEKQPIREKGRVVDYQRVLVDEGVEDKRLLLIEEEFAQALKVMSREGNILSPILRQAWDHGTMRPLVKNNPICATNAHISIVGHITRIELLRYLNDVEMANGCANRFLWAMVRRSKSLPNPQGVPERELNPLIIRLQHAVQAAKQLGEMRRDDDAERLWTDLYASLSQGQPGLFGAITARAEVQVMRLAAIYAALDGTAIIQVEHLQAALAVWQYCEASARYIFGDSTGDPVADRILTALQEEGPMDRTAISGLFGRHMPGARIDRAITTLKQAGRVVLDEIRKPQGGRPPAIVKLAGA